MAQAIADPIENLENPDLRIAWEQAKYTKIRNEAGFVFVAESIVNYRCSILLFAVNFLYFINWYWLLRSKRKEVLICNWTKLVLRVLSILSSQKIAAHEDKPSLSFI